MAIWFSALDLPEPIAGLEQVMLAGVPVLRRRAHRPSSQALPPLVALPPHNEAVPQVSERQSSAPYRDAAVALLAAARSAADSGHLPRALERSTPRLRCVAARALHLLALILSEQGTALAPRCPAGSRRPGPRVYSGAPEPGPV